MEEQNDIKRFLNSGAGVALKGYLQSKLEELKDIGNIKEQDTPIAQAIEIKASLRAHKKLKNILSELMTISEEPRPKDPRDSFNCE